MQKQFLILFYLIFQFSLLVAQPSDSNPLGIEPGKCYAKCLIGDEYEHWEESYPVYLGPYNDSIDFLEIVELTLEDGVMDEIVIVSDTSQTNDYEWEIFEFSESIQEGGYTDWKEVLCVNKTTLRIKLAIQKALINYGYNLNENGIIGTETKAALVQFQKANNLPIGSLDIETLDFLGIDY